ncbi:cathepsin W isoform X2 [Echinops telfairi]|uniref:Cathepsin W isoform X2 n=1 Tax=Echinops telfairi TaxID=9371 RepID=A0AC55DN93_ECHTE|nr:cathepsin W isoform X2 [Echinops telfairi]
MARPPPLFLHPRTPKSRLPERDPKAPGPLPQELKEVFTRFQVRYNRSYANPAELARRVDIFARNLARAQQLQDKDLGTAEFGVTPFSDLTEEEFGQMYGHQQVPATALHMSRQVGFGPEAGEKLPPSTCDWRKQEYIIKSVRDQKNCNCCWAIAAAGNVEALWAIEQRTSVEVSVQQLVDCDRCGGGCTGGFVWDAFMTVLNYSGLASEKKYPFKGTFKPHQCRANNFKKVAWIRDFIMLQDNEQLIAQYLAIHGPITVTINSKLLQQYRKGVIKPTPDTCDPRFVNHSVLLMGFGQTKRTWTETRQGGTQGRPIPYWILKNSWGPNWGEEGYFRLHRGSNACGITKYPFTARLGKSTVRPVHCPPAS